MELQTYTVVDMAKVMLRVDRLNRENKDLREKLGRAESTVAELEKDNSEQLRRLADFEGHYSRQRTAGLTLRLERG
jgi:hypothetical protein